MAILLLSPLLLLPPLWWRWLLQRILQFKGFQPEWCIDIVLEIHHSGWEPSYIISTATATTILLLSLLILELLLLLQPLSQMYAYDLKCIQQSRPCFKAENQDTMFVCVSDQDNLHKWFCPSILIQLFLLLCSFFTSRRSHPVVYYSLCMSEKC